VNVDDFFKIFDRLDRELWLITARAGERCSGLIATYVSRVSLVPEFPRVTIALAKHHFTRELIEATGAFCMHLIGEDSIDWVWRFGIPSGREVDKLRGLITSTGATGSPILAEAPAWLDCRVEAQMDTGDRTIYLAKVIDARLDQITRDETGAESRRPLTFKRLLELAPAERLREMKQSLERDVELDRNAILDWRRGHVADGTEGNAAD
jgi:flavin reductase (DIM6/NTAB) family NADH-FMN oxidoreductase RutF